MLIKGQSKRSILSLFKEAEDIVLNYITVIAPPFPFIEERLEETQGKNIKYLIFKLYLSSFKSIHIYIFCMEGEVSIVSQSYIGTISYPVFKS